MNTSWKQEYHIPVDYAYDLAGRRTLIESPDAGRITFEYDEAGNPVKKVDSRLRAKGQSIRYSYDGHNRLIRIEYPETADTTFEYGTGSQTDENQAGRLVRRSDSSGTIEYRYGKLGEVLFAGRSLNRLSPGAPAKSAETGFVCDYLGRLESITYPDTEVVSYSYTAGGQVNHVEGRQQRNDHRIHRRDRLRRVWTAGIYGVRQQSRNRVQL